MGLRFQNAIHKALYDVEYQWMRALSLYCPIYHIGVTPIYVLSFKADSESELFLKYHYDGVEE